MASADLEVVVQVVVVQVVAGNDFLNLYFDVPCLEKCGTFYFRFKPCLMIIQKIYVHFANIILYKYAYNIKKLEY